MSKFSALSLTTEKPTRVLLKKPDGTALLDADKQAAYVDIYSTDSTKFQAAQRSIVDRRMEGGKITAAVIREEGVERLAEMTDGWHLVDFAGNKIDIEFSVANAKELYADPTCAWIADQVSNASSNRENFMPAPLSA